MILAAVLGVFFGQVKPGAAKPQVIQLEAKVYTRTSPIEISSNGAVLDGHGATLKGPGTGIGVHVGNYKGVTIKNLKIVGFATGLLANGASGLKLVGVTILGAENGPALRVPPG